MYADMFDLEDLADDPTYGVSTDAYEADIFLNSRRVAVVTKRVVAELRRHVAAKQISRWQFVSNAPYREMWINKIVARVATRLYTDHHRKAGARKPAPSPKLVRALVSAYRRKARGFASILRMGRFLTGALFEDEADEMRPRISNRALAGAAQNTARAFRERYLRAPKVSPARKAALQYDVEMLNRMLSDVIGSGGLTQPEVDEIASILEGMEQRLAALH
jgi:hypothetical protein